jgi:segregation and condensation protein B
MGRRPKSNGELDVELTDLPADLRWREWMGRVEAIIFAAAEPVTRQTLARVVGQECSIDALIEDIREELRERPYELAAVAGGFVLRTKKTFAAAIRAATGQGTEVRALSQLESLVLLAIALFQPITRAELGRFFGKEISRDLIAALRGHAFIGPGPRSPLPGAPYTYVTTKTFLAHFGFDTLRDLPDFESLEAAGLLCKERVLAGEFGAAFKQGEGKFEGEAAFDEIE